MLVGYMRVSSDGNRQVPDLRRNAPLAAGVDALLVCHTPEAQHEVVAHLAAAVMDGVIPEARALEARARLARLAARHARPVAAAV